MDNITMAEYFYIILVVAVAIIIYFLQPIIKEKKFLNESIKVANLKYNVPISYSKLILKLEKKSLYDFFLNRLKEESSQKYKPLLSKTKVDAFSLCLHNSFMFDCKNVSALLSNKSNFIEPKKENFKNERDFFFECQKHNRNLFNIERHKLLNLAGISDTQIIEFSKKENQFIKLVSI